MFWRRKPKDEIEAERDVEREADLDPGSEVEPDWEPDPADFEDPAPPLSAESPVAEPAAPAAAVAAPSPVAEPAPSALPPVAEPPPPAEPVAAGIPGWPASIETYFPPSPDLAGEPAGSLESGVARSRGGFVSRLRGLLGGSDADGPSWEEVEETLIGGDVGGALAIDVVERARRRHDPDGNLAAVRLELAALLAPRDPDWRPRPSAPGQPAVVLIVGVNGTGKTTTIGKLASRYRSEGLSVILAAADTFRAAAMEQLGIWASRSGSTMIAHAPGADPGAVVYDALDAAVARNTDMVIADTAGRLHTKVNLMDELAKVRRIIDKRLPGAQPEVLFVLDATTGQNGLAQARAFHEATGLTGIVLTKLDSTAKGGIVFAIEADLGVPVRFVGVGEQVGDLLPFDPDAFVAALFADA
jgi:fused signal recognition particle receptor